MILWKSLHIEVYRDTHDQASTSVAGDQHGLLFGSWMISGRVRRRMRRPPMIIYLIPVGLASCAAGRPRQSGVGGALAVSPRGSGEPHDQRRVAGVPSCCGVDHLRGDDGS